METMQLVTSLTPGALLLAGLALNTLLMLAAWFAAEVLPAMSATTVLRARAATVLRPAFPRAPAAVASRFEPACLLEREAA